MEQRTLATQLSELLDDQRESLYEMSNLWQDETGLTRIVWISVKSGKEGHGPRIKVQRDKGNKAKVNNWFSVTISEEPVIKDKSRQLDLSNREFRLIKEWIIKNRKYLLKYWNSEISTSKVMAELQSL